MMHLSKLKSLSKLVDWLGLLYHNGGDFDDLQCFSPLFGVFIKEYEYDVEKVSGPKDWAYLTEVRAH